MTAGSGQEGMSLLRACKPPMVLLDAHLPDITGIEILKLILKELPQSKTILFSTHQDMNTTIQAIKLGAYDYVLEDTDLEELDRKIQKAIRVQKLNAENTSSEQARVFFLLGLHLDRPEQGHAGYLQIYRTDLQYHRFGGHPGRDWNGQETVGPCDP